jgi:Sec-independent protein translocase protein TatA
MSRPAPERPVLALFTDLSFSELLVIAALSVMVFGRDLPRVAARGIVQFQRIRRALQQVWRESGISEEVRRVQRDVERAAREARDAVPEDPITGAVRGVSDELERGLEPPGSPDAPTTAAGAPAEASADPDPAGPSGPAGDSEPADLTEPAPDAEPAGEAERRAAWYPRAEDDPFGRDPA